MKTSDKKYLAAVCDHMRSHGAKTFTLFKSESERRVVLRGYDGDRMVMERDVHTCRTRKHATHWHTVNAMRQRCDKAYQRLSEVLYHYCIEHKL